MSEKRRGLGRGLGALIPQAPPPTKAGGDRPVDVFFGDGEASDATATDGGSANGAAPAGAVTAKAGGAADSGSAEAADGKAGPKTDTKTTSRTDAKTEAKPGSKTDAKADAKSGDKRASSGDAAAAGTNGAPSGTTVTPKDIAAAMAAGASGTSAPTAEGSSTAATDATPTPTPTSGVTEAPATAEPAATDATTSFDDGTALVPVPGAQFAELPVGSITPNPKQPRQVFDEEALAELVHSVREIGILQPIVVRSVPSDDEPRYELIMGERRWRAAQEAGFERVPAIIRETSDDDLLRDALLENLHRSQLNPLEEAAAYQQLLEDFGCTHEELATRIGRSRPQISNTIRLLRLPPTVQRRVAAGVLSAGHARALLGLDDAEAMDKFAQRIVNEGLSVRATEEAVALSDGGPSSSPRRKPRPGSHSAELDDLAGRLADRLDTRVKISLGSSKGKLSVEFASIEDLNRILEILAPGERGAFQG